MNPQTKKKNLKKKLEKTPDSPVFYVFKDSSGDVIYVGKAVSLKSRVSSYFSQVSDDRTAFLRPEIADFEVIPVSSEGEALVLESLLIKKHQPQFNVNLKDGKTYPYVKISGDPFPYVSVVREVKSKDADYYGPFTDVKSLKQVLRFIRRFFPFRTCGMKITGRSARPCTAFHIKKCAGPCIGKIDEKDYRQIIEGVRAFFAGAYRKYMEKMKIQMTQSVRAWDFENARLLFSRIVLLEKMKQSIPWRREEELLEYRDQNVLSRIAEIFHLEKIPAVIEGYDISNLGETLATGSRVTFRGGVPCKDGYRKYKIKTVDGVDDYEMLREVLRRRFDSKEDDKPDLILIDGGRGHLWTAISVLAGMKIKISVISIAKKEEAIYTEFSKEPVLLAGDAPELHFLQRIRDEAHRFALGYHLKLRRKNVTSSRIDRIKGIGPKRKKIILGILSANPGRFPEEELAAAKIPGDIIKRLAQPDL